MRGKYFLTFILFLLSFTCFSAYAQDDSTETHYDFSLIRQMEDSMLITVDSMYYAFLPDDRPMYTQRFVRQLLKALKVPNSWKYEFPKLKEEINITYSPDKEFRIFNWVIAPSLNGRRYYGAIQLPTEELKLYPLVDYSLGMKKCEEDNVLTNGKWFGGLIYRIIPKEVDGETIYTIFSANGANPLSTRKILDPMVLTEKGPVFGAPIFDITSECRTGERINRFIIEYKKDVQASMNWDKEYEAIVFDRLVSQNNDPNRKYTYVPTGQYDGFKWKGEQWSFVKNLIPIELREDGEAPTPTPIFGDKDDN